MVEISKGGRVTGVVPGKQGGWPRRWVWIGMAAAGVVLVGALVWLFVTAPDLYPTASYDDAAGRASAIAATRTAAMAGFVGLAAIGGLIANAITARANTTNAAAAQDNVRIAQQAQATAQQTAVTTAEATRETLRLTERGELTERYIKAVELLGHDNEMSIVGGIYALERLAGDSPDDRPTIVEVLAAYVRHRAGLSTPQVDREVVAPVRAAMSVLGRIAPPPPAELEALEALIPASRQAFVDGLRDSAATPDLRWVNLRHLDLPGADLRGANLSRADLTEANLIGADLRFARLEGADLSRAHLNHAKLMGARLANAYLNDADLTEAILGPCESQIEAVDLRGTHFDGTHLEIADLRGIYLGRVRGLTQEQLEVARGDANTTLPANLQRPEEWTEPGW